VAEARSRRRTVTMIGLHGGQWFGAAAGDALKRATVLIGASRHLDSLPPDLGGLRVPLATPVSRALDQIALYRDREEQVCVLVSGDPGFFGLARLAAARLAPDRVAQHPAPSSIALAFARIGDHWDDAVVISAHGRPLQPAIDAVLAHPKVAVLAGPDCPPEELGRSLLRAGSLPRVVAVVSRIGEADEALWEGDPTGLADGSFDPMSVVIVRSPSAASGPGWSWGLPDGRYEHRDGMITKAEVRAVALGKLAIPPAGVMWDVGAGSGSISAECARLAPGLQIFAVERENDGAARVRRNLAGTAAVVVEGVAPAVLGDLPDPDRVFVGGGGLEVIDATLRRLHPGGTVVATFAVLDRAAEAAERLGHLVQVSVSRGVRVGAGRSVRLAAENPVFVCWGPAE
jgi:precorrin-6B C5,15-methyltransferase / cobalt-precorrin-6B C5,C15-methyltransferase